MHRVHQMFVEEQCAVRPKCFAGFGFNEASVEYKTCENRAQCQHAQRNEHRQRTFMRMIASGTVNMRVVGMIIMVTMVVHRMLNMLRMRPTRRPEECEEHQAPAVEAGQQCSQNANAKRIHVEGRVARKCSFDDRILGIEPSEPADTNNTNTGNRQGARHHRPEGERDMFPQTAIITHVLLMMHRMDD